VRRLAVLALLMGVIVNQGRAQTRGCEVPDGMTKEQKLPCGASTFSWISCAHGGSVGEGPDFDSADAEKSRFAYFTGEDTISCYFRPHYAFAKVPGDSMKFQCWHMPRRSVLQP